MVRGRLLFFGMLLKRDEKLAKKRCDQLFALTSDQLDGRRLAGEVDLFRQSKAFLLT